MTDDDVAFASIADLASRLHRQEVTPVAVTERLLERIRALDPRLHAFIAVTADRALAQAHAAEIALRGGHDLGPLHGVPIRRQGSVQRGGRRDDGRHALLARNVAEADCAAVRWLCAAGMVLLGKTHTVQFAFGGVGINHDHGTPHNPWEPSRMSMSATSRGAAW